MKKSEVAYIEKNRSDLITYTRCETIFLVQLISKGVITDEEKDEIMSKTTTIAKSDLLYTIVKTRRDGFSVLIEALKETRQTEALHILEGYYDVKVTNKVRSPSKAVSHTDCGKITWQKFLISANLDNITAETHNAQAIIDGLAKQGVISERQRSVWKYWYDKDETNKKAELYTMQYERPNSYEILMDILHYTGHFEVSKILSMGMNVDFAKSIFQEDVFFRISHAIAWGQDKTFIIQLISKFPPMDVISCEGPNGENLLHVAVGCGHVQMIRYFYEIGISFSSTDNNGNSCSHYIGSWATYNMVEVTKTLIDLGASLYKTNKQRQTIAHVLPKKLQSPAYFHLWVKFMIHAGNGDIFLKVDADRNIPVDCAIEYLEVLEETLKILSRHCNINDKRKKGRTILHLAALHGRPKETLEVIINCGGGLKVTDDNMVTVLHYAVWGGNIAAVKYFADLGVDVNAKDKYGRRPLHFLCYAPLNHIEMTQLLLSYGADLHALDSYRCNCAHGWQDMWKQKRDQYGHWTRYIIKIGEGELLEMVKK